jgi:hypothetical protein
LLRIGPGRLSFPHLIEKHAIEGGTEKYSTALLLPPDFDIRPLLEALNKLCRETWNQDRAKWPTNARKPEQVIRRCEEKAHLAGYEPGWHFISASTNEQPTIVGWDKEPITNPRETYAGRWANISARPFIYNNVGVGISLGLNNVQLLQHAPAFGRTSAAQDFDVVAEAVDGDF